MTGTPTQTGTPTPTTDRIGPIISAIQPVAQNGCPGCCSFNCRLTPTPTPEFDSKGRRVYTAADRFLFIVETGFGASLLDAGSEGSIVGGEVSDIVHASMRPSLQVLGEADFGNGSSTICDGSPFDPPGGVPGFSPPLIDCTSPDLPPQGVIDCEATQPAVRDALEDMACRFSFVVTRANSCTKNRFGDFDFLSPFSTRQFCFQIPIDSALPAGEWVIAVQARDIVGNLGPLDEIVVRVSPVP